MTDKKRISILEQIVRIQNDLLMGLVSQNVDLEEEEEISGCLFAEDYQASANKLNRLFDQLKEQHGSSR